MGKKDRRNKQPPSGRKKTKPWAVLGVGATVVVGLASWGWLGSKGTDPHADLLYSSTGVHQRHENGEPLSPTLFVGQTARSYQIAHEIPEILDQLYCYCECDKHMGHKTLLSCFIDSHAAT